MAVRDDFTAGEVLAAADLNDTFGAKLNLAGGKILQIVRATDATDRTTSSATFVDASFSVTITPQKNTSAVLLIHTCNVGSVGDDGTFLQITDSSNNTISGAESNLLAAITGNIIDSIIQVAYATPATTSATTFKVRFRRNNGGPSTLRNSNNTGQLYAIEVSA